MIWGRLKAFAGDVRQIPTIAISGTTLLEIPENSNDFIVTGAATPVVSTLNALGKVLPGRVVTFITSGSTAVVFTSNDNTTTKGQMGCGGDDVTLAATDTLVLKQMNNGSWQMLSNATNNS